MSTTGKPVNQKSGGKEGKQHRKDAPYTQYYYLGWQFVFSFLLYAGIGYALDAWLGTLPIFLLMGVVVGMVAVFVLLFRVVKDMDPNK